jgi:hypothetical protein
MNDVRVAKRRKQMFGLQRKGLSPVVTLVALTGGALVIVRTSSTLAQTSNGPEFVAHVAIERLDGRGRLGMVENLLHGERADGSFVDMRISQNSKILNKRVLVDRSIRARVVIDPATQSITTYRIADTQNLPRSSGLLPFRAGGCEATLAGETQEMLGFRTVRRQEAQRIGNAELRTESWVAPALNCFPLKVETVLSRNGNISAKNVYEVVSLSRGKPDPQLFAVPQQYRERAPSEVFVLASGISGKQCLICSKGVEVLDAAYQSSR